MCLYTLSLKKINDQRNLTYKWKSFLWGSTNKLFPGTVHCYLAGVNLNQTHTLFVASRVASQLTNTVARVSARLHHFGNPMLHSECKCYLHDVSLESRCSPRLFLAEHQVSWKSKLKLVLIDCFPQYSKHSSQCFCQTAPFWESRVAFREDPQKNGERANLALYFYKV